MSQAERKLLLSGFMSTLSHGEKKTRSRGGEGGDNENKIQNRTNKTGEVSVITQQVGLSPPCWKPELSGRESRRPPPRTVKDTRLQALRNRTPLTFLLISVNWENIKDQYNDSSSM